MAIVHGEAVVCATERKSQSDWYSTRLRCTYLLIESRLLANDCANVPTNAHFLQVFMNIVLDDAVEEKADGGKDRLGMVVRSHIATIGSW